MAEHVGLRGDHPIQKNDATNDMEVFFFSSPRARRVVECSCILRHNLENK